MKKRMAALCLVLAVTNLLAGCAEVRVAGPTEPTEPPPLETPAATAEPTPLETAVASTPEPVELTITSLSVGDPYTGFGGATLTIAEKVGTPDMGDSEITLTALSGGQETAVKAEGFFESAYYIENPGGACVVLSVDESGTELYRTYVYALAGGSLAQTSKANGYVAHVAGNSGDLAATATICKWVDILGSYRACRDYKLNAEFVLEPAGDGLWYVLEDEVYQENIEYYTLATTRKIPVQALEDGQYRDATLGPDQNIRVTAWDGESTVYYLNASDGSAGRLFVVLDKDNGEWGRAYLIDGVPEFDCFAELPYAG